MFKRVFLVLTLLFAQVTFGQQISVEQNDLDENVNASSSPVVAVESATGSVEQDESNTVFVSGSTTPAEAVEQKTTNGADSLIVTGIGASSTSSTPAASTIVETEESTSTNPTTKETDDKFFSLAFAGFEEFVERFFGWE